MAWILTLRARDQFSVLIPSPRCGRYVLTVRSGCVLICIGTLPDAETVQHCADIRNEGIARRIVYDQPVEYGAA